MIVWGGVFFDDSGAAHRYDTGGVYDPTVDAWIATSQASAPAARSTRGVWTGSELVVWAGTGEGAYALDTGGRFDPVTDVWVATSMEGVPNARAGNTIVWTGSAVIVWGGLANGFLGTGGAYLP
jgi:hypothetical protein